MSAVEVTRGIPPHVPNFSPSKSISLFRAIWRLPLCKSCPSFLLSLARQFAMCGIGFSHEQNEASYPIVESNQEGRFVICNPPHSIHFPRTSSDWRVGPAISRQRYHEQDVGVMAESRVDYIATRIDEPQYPIQEKSQKRSNLPPLPEPLHVSKAVLRIWQE